METDFLYQAYRDLLSRAEEEAKQRGIPLDGSWVFNVTTDCNNSEFQVKFRIAGQWTKT